mmetsp:Transcript_18007/g.44992  ORF Transcript_18007/g.44992 Transcript_18007/m.44992 type:complete len:214 (+) Transcript_18007:3528-4169(+)
MVRLEAPWRETTVKRFAEGLRSCPAGGRRRSRRFPGPFCFARDKKTLPFLGNWPTSRRTSPFNLLTRSRYAWGLPTNRDRGSVTEKSLRLRTQKLTTNSKLRTSDPGFRVDARGRRKSKSSTTYTEISTQETMLESQRGSKTRMIAIACFGVVAVNENGNMEMCSLEIDLSSTSVRRFLCNPKRSKKYRKGLWVDALPGRVRHPGAGAPAKNP